MVLQIRSPLALLILTKVLTKAPAVAPVKKGGTNGEFKVPLNNGGFGDLLSVALFYEIGITTHKVGSSTHRFDRNF
jgi:hypothetical protein